MEPIPTKFMFAAAATTTTTINLSKSPEMPTNLGKAPEMSDLNWDVQPL